jgi:hypothetical protein
MPTIFIREKTDLPTASAHDFYPTPAGLVEKVLFDLVGSRLVPTLPFFALDIGANTGIWGEGLRHFCHDVFLTGIEIQDMPMPSVYDQWYCGDFLAAEFRMPYQFDFIMGNPPYSINNPIIERAWKLLMPEGVMAFLFKTNILNGVWRTNHIYHRYPPAEVWMLPRRVSFSGNKKTNADEYCIVVWKKQRPLPDTTLWWVFHENNTEFTWNKQPK